MTLFHITTSKNWQKIQQEGLKPRKIKRGKGFAHSKPAIYLFNTKEEAQDGFFNWLEDLFEEDEEVVLLAVNVSSDIIEPDPELPLSCSISLVPIAAESIAFLEVM